MRLFRRHTPCYTSVAHFGQGERKGRDTMNAQGMDKVKKEYPRIDALRVRLLETADGVKLDVREYVDGGAPGAFEGFTRKGIRLDGEGMQSLYHVLADIFAGPVRVVCSNTLPAAVAPAPAPVTKAAPAARRAAPAVVVPSTVKARAAQLAPAVTPGPACSPAVEALKARMRGGATVSLADIMAASAPAAPAPVAPAPVKTKAAPVKAAPAPTPSAAEVKEMLGRTTASGQRVGEYILGDILEETEKNLKHV